MPPGSQVAPRRATPPGALAEVAGGLAAALALGTAALGAAAFLASGGLRGLTLAVWGYFLVQSASFLIGGRRPRGPQPAKDPFERARARLERLAPDAADAPRP